MRGFLFCRRKNLAGSVVPDIADCVPKRALGVPSARCRLARQIVVAARARLLVMFVYLKALIVGVGVLY